MSHPAHPATVHFPITTTVFTGGLDAVYFASKFAPTASIVASTFKTLGIAIQPSLFPVLSYYTTILTLLFTVPAIVTGAQQLMPVIQRDGFSSKKAKLGVMHALINDIAAIGALYNWWSRRDNPGFTPDATNMLISTVVALPTTLYAAYLGGSLVYIHGMGFQNRSAKKTQ
ncbi:hypothetical protein HBI56_100270 [Parastagonospora nodorum]|uniref:DUF2231 domain-containing protein n=2 Tax=Phaeosphaeria nodorum (strain SN15 / ATCC MYA-4574 / FGSC 10173) TaxID=321614 RepID=A0A7U2F5L9_PHANO|nr:hypothetical protein SNOG_06507 [Parastagonospora nodorum SN15]KAH3919128.1 hypothetical protein HBH56_029200 [Parastagonospora nodorum]EAT86338.1 hypothetical protein SNOG_06507 [Parastagonospora nodorum SN15]KAH3934217.1 hypothetical protein HBH54_052830 [Parastagonospora nodorum]KAH3943078.1 hypothetical protein HBH53_177880 [Parastagonospora nodorum]KAH3959281.1 hypothetical protein HBH51_200240 [Parastagonospora nodorum]